DVIERCIKSVPFAREVIVVDSGSTDRTREICDELGAKVILRGWKGYGEQKHFANTQAGSEWILSLDADEWLSHELAEEIYKNLSADPVSSDVYSMKRLSRYLGKWIYHGGWFPDFQKRLFRKKCAEWLPEEKIHESVRVKDGAREFNLNELMYHEPFSSIYEQCDVNFGYAELLAEKKYKSGKRIKNPLVIIIRTMFRFIQNYFVKMGFLDGLPGFIIAWNSAQSYMLQNYSIYIKTVQRKGK
ncbi:MAG: glycosyltransferase family 2 protein, partial [Oligoflexia bacterium]|nr:glycosyltransferase family 2 protein [Oligoflexia bacterium]